MRFKTKVILGSVTTLTLLSVLLINVGWTHTRSAAAGTFPGAYGFRPGEWQYVTTTTGPFLGTSRSTSMRCSRSFYQPQDTANATLSTPGAPHGTVHCVTSHPSLHATTRNCRTISIGEVITTHTLYTGEGRHFQMQGHGSIVNNGKLFESYTTHGKWLSKACLAHPPAPTSEQIKPSKQMQLFLSQAAKIQAEAAQMKKAMPAEEAQANAATATMKSRISKLEAKDARAGIAIPASN